MAFGMVVLVAAIVGFAFSRIYTVVTGVADVAHYFEAARSILEAPTWAARLQAALVWAPVHPALLAGIGARFGFEWTYFLNPVFIVGFLCGMGAWGWRAMNDARGGLLTALAGAALMLFGYDQAAHSLIYPYRESLSFLFIFAALLATLLAFPAGEAPRRRWLFCAGSGYVLAAAVREPSILALAGAVAYLLAQPRENLRARAFDILALVAPVVLALAILAGIFVATGIVGSQQFTGWRLLSAHTSMSAWAGMYRTYLNCLIQFLGPWGGAVSAVGLVWLARKNRAAVHALVWPLLFTVGLYSTFTFHPRYALSAAIFAVPFLGAGIRAIASGLAYAAGKRRPWVDAGVCGLGAGALVIYCLVQAASLAPWGGVVRRQIRDLEQTLRAQMEPSARVLADPRSRLLKETLRTYLGIDPAQRFETGTLAPGKPAWLFVRPTNPDAVVRANVQIPPVGMEAAIRRNADLESVCDVAGQPIRLSLGRGEYALERVRPWSRNRIEQDMTGADVVGGLLWLDFQQSDAQARRDVQVLAADGAVLGQWSIANGNGLVPLAVDARAGRNACRLVAISSSPLPAKVLAHPIRTTRGGYFGLGMDRSPAVMDWVVPPTVLSPQGKWAATFVGSARFAIPAPRGAGTDSWALSIWLDPRFAQGESVVFRYGGAGAEPTTRTNRLDRGRIRHDVPLRLGAGGESCTVDVEVDVPKGWGNHFRVVGLGVTRPSAD